MPGINQLTLTVTGVYAAPTALILASTAGLRGEFQAIRTEMRAEIRDVRVEALSTDRHCVILQCTVEGLKSGAAAALPENRIAYTFGAAVTADDSEPVERAVSGAFE